MAVHGGLALLMAGIFMAVQSLVLKPLNEKHQTARQQVSEIDTILERTSEFAEENASLVEKMKSIQSRADLINDRIPASPKEAEFLQPATTAAKQTNIEILDYNRGETDSVGDYAELHVHFTIQGGYEDLCEFISRVENLPRISRVNQVKMETDSRSDIYPIDLSLILFFTRDAPLERLARAPDG